MLEHLSQFGGKEVLAQANPITKLVFVTLPSMLYCFGNRFPFSETQASEILSRFQGWAIRDTISGVNELNGDISIAIHASFRCR